MTLTPHVASEPDVYGMRNDKSGGYAVGCNGGVTLTFPDTVTVNNNLKIHNNNNNNEAIPSKMVKINQMNADNLCIQCPTKQTQYKGLL